MAEIATFSSFLAALYAANTTAVSITAPVATTTAPTGDGVFDTTYTRDARDQFNSLALFFYGAGADNATGTARVTGWQKAGTLWVPVPLLALNLTLGQSVGVAAADVLDTERFADTVAASTAFTSAYEIISPTDNSPASVKLDFFGCRRVQVQLAVGTATSLNALAAGF